jgi:hypothetical protein
MNMEQPKSARLRVSDIGRFGFGSLSLPTPLQLFQLVLQGLQLSSRITEPSGGGELLIVRQIACRIGD